MTAVRQPSLFELPPVPEKVRVPLPAEPTVTQLEAAAVLAPHKDSLMRLVRSNVECRGALGATPKEMAGWLGAEVVTIRARFTELHQGGELIRTMRRRDRQYVYVHPRYWATVMGTVPSRPHRGRRV